MSDNDKEKNEQNLGEEVDELLEQGLDQKEIEARGYSPSLVRQRIRQQAKAGKGGSPPPRRGSSLAIRKEKESVLPEWLERDVAEIFDGQVRDQRIFLAGMSVPLMGLRLFAEGVKPIINLLETWQKGQAEAAQAVQKSGIEIANTAGEAAAGGVAKFFMETKPWLAANPDPMKSMMVDTMRPIFQQVIGQLMDSLMRSTPQGQGNIPSPPSGVQGQAGFQSPQPGQPGFQQVGGVQQASDGEIKEVFGD